MHTSLRRELTAALKARDSAAVAALRSALAAIANAEALPARGAPEPNAVGSERIAGSAAGLGAAEAERRHLTETEVRAIIEAEVQERSVAANDYVRVGRDDVAERLRAEADVLRRYVAPLR